MIVGTGIDIIQIKRIERVWERFGNSFLMRVYTQRERDYCLGKSFPAPHLAARFAAKEACAKALGTGFRGFGMQEIGVHLDSKGSPFLELTGGARGIMGDLGIHHFFLSLSHCREYAIAQVIAMKEREVDHGGCYSYPDAED